MLYSYNLELSRDLSNRLIKIICFSSYKIDVVQNVPLLFHSKYLLTLFTGEIPKIDNINYIQFVKLE